MSRVMQLFGVLDIVSVVLLLLQFIAMLASGGKSAPAIEGINHLILIPQLILFPLLIVSAVGLLQQKIYGVIAYYIQFLFRFPALVFTFGFVTYVDKWFGTWDVTRYTLALAVFGELLRLTHSIQTHIHVKRTAKEVV